MTLFFLVPRGLDRICVGRGCGWLFLIQIYVYCNAALRYYCTKREEGEKGEPG